MTKYKIDGFDTPVGPPQLEDESLQQEGNLADLLDQVGNPIDSDGNFDESLALEFALLFRKHLAVRAFVALAKHKVDQLRVDVEDLNSMDEIRLNQGGIRALKWHYKAVLALMSEAETANAPHEEPNEELEQE